MAGRPEQSVHKAEDGQESLIPNPLRAWKGDLLFGLLISAIAFLVYANSMGNGFVWDDANVITANPVLRGAARSLFHTLDTAGGKNIPYYRPLTLLSFLIEERLHGLMPILMHLANILLHAANAFLVYLLAQYLIKDHTASLLAGLLFAVHPLNAESVNFISGGRNTMLACLFVLLAFLSHVKGLTLKTNSAVITGSVFFTAGLFSKETAVMLLPFIAALEFPNYRSSIPGAKLQAIGRLAPYAGGMGFYVVMRWMTLADHGIHMNILSGLGARLLDNLYIIPRYLLSVSVPTTLSARYVVPEGHLMPTVMLIVAWFCMIAMIGWMLSRGRSRATLFGIAWLTAFWLPVSGIIPFPSVPLADRYLYLPAIGLWIIVADQAVRLFPTGPSARRYGVIAIALALLVLTMVTVRRNLEWNGNIALFSKLVEQYPESAYGHAGLGAAYLDRQDASDLERAEQELTKALTLEPSLQEVFVPLGHVRLIRGDFEGALYFYSQALRKDPADTEARLNRGIALERLGRTKDAIADYQEFLALPDDTAMQGSRQFAEEKVRELSRRTGI
ncbi:MAG: tetratricopeptide repeat protein [Nitrospirota bacterium]